MKLDLSSNKSIIIEELGKIDWSFPTLTNSGLHSFHWYPATYLAAIPGSIIPHITLSGDTVLDPFCGSGTTGVEAIRLSRKFIGIDTNPVALLITEAKLKFLGLQSLKNGLEKIINDSQSVFAIRRKESHPHQEELLDWYHPETMHELNDILTAILTLKDRLLQRTFLSIFSAILKNCSSQGRHWGWVCDNVKPRNEEIVYKNAYTIFTNAVTEFSRASEYTFRECKDYSPRLTREKIRKQSKLMQGSCISKLADLSPGSIDAIVTSPPYYGVADYVKSQRLTYLWFDKEELAKDRLGFRDFEILRTFEAGARSTRHKKNSHELYIEFMNQFFECCHHALKTTGIMSLVVGESLSRAATTEQLISLATRHNFSLETRVGRDIRPNRRRLMAKVKGEDILFFSK